MAIVLDGKSLNEKKLYAVAVGGEKLEIAQSAKQNIIACRTFLDEKIAEGEVIYGVNTGIGKLAEVVLKPNQLKEFQTNLIMSHTAGCGEAFPEHLVRAAWVSRVNCLCNGHSGVRLEVVEKMVELLNAHVTPVVYRKGSVGACGDLAPMAQSALVLMGMGEAFFLGERMTGAEALRRANIERIEFHVRDGLAVINGANFITGIGAVAICEAEYLIEAAEVATAATLEVLNAQTAALDERIFMVRPFSGAAQSAKNIRNLISNSQMLSGVLGEKKVQDAYSMRSAPQVIGAARDALKWVREQIEIELNSVGDNPIFFHADGDVIAGANFQGTPVALPLELLGIALTNVAVISERRINRLMNPALSCGLPAFLTYEPGMNSGLMILQYTADMLLSHAKVLCSPAAIHSLPAAADQEDYVSMGMTTAQKTLEILDDCAAVVALELISSLQAVDLRAPHIPGDGVRAIHSFVRKGVPFFEHDEPYSDYINYTTKLILSGEISRAVRNVINA